MYCFGSLWLLIQLLSDGAFFIWHWGISFDFSEEEEEEEEEEGDTGKPAP